jgi:hypothetical protein
MLKAIATIASLAVLLWSLGLPSLQIVDAANLTTVSDTLSDTTPNASSTHLFEFTTPTGVAAGEAITIDFGSTGFDLSHIGVDDIDLATTSDYALQAGSPVGATWGVATTSSTIVITSASGVIAANATVTIEIGTNATNGATGNNDILNPGTTGSKKISLSAGSADSGTAMVVILDSVTVSATVDTVFNFSVAGTQAGTALAGAETSTGSTSATAIPFGKLSDGNATTAAQLLTVSTNAKNGYNVTVQVDGPLQSSTGADINYFADGSATDTPIAWAQPTGTVGSPDTYGHWGVTSDDASISSRSSQFSTTTARFVSVSTSPHVIMANDGPANGAGQGIGTTTVGYRAEITALQEAGDDYSAVLTYIATPTF